MRRGWIVLGMLSAAALTLMLALGSREEPEAARIVCVQKGSVRQIAALTGRVGYEGEIAVYALAPGQVAQICVQEGERVAQGQALVRMKAEAAERAASVWAAQEDPALSGEDVQALLEAGVIRSPENATVRRILTQPHAVVTAGTPVAALTTGGQIIRCMANVADAEHVRPGMTATLLLDGAELQSAKVLTVGEVTADALTGVRRAEICLTPSKPLELPVGSAVDADVCIAAREGVPTLPLEAVTERGTIWWVHDGICTEIPAEIVHSDEMNVWVRLPEGVAVAVGEFMEGQRIREAVD